MARRELTRIGSNVLELLGPEEKIRLIAALVQQMTLADKRRLAERLASDRDFVEELVPRSHFRLIIDLMMQRTRESNQAGLAMAATLVEESNKAHRRGNCARVKKDRNAQRHLAIDKCQEVGITEPEDILKHLIEHSPKLVRKGKKGTIWISADSMMAAYRRSKRPG